MNVYDCKKPVPWEDNKGKQTNVCKVCGGEIHKRTPPTSDIGPLIISLQGAVDRLGFRSEDERRVFLEQYGKNLDETLRQSLLTFRANRATQADVSQAEQLDKARRSGH